jgi:hypothetical protein
VRRRAVGARRERGAGPRGGTLAFAGSVASKLSPTRVTRLTLADGFGTVTVNDSLPQYALMGCYSLAAGGASVTGSSPPRTWMKMDSSGNIDTSLSMPETVNWRAIASLNGTQVGGSPPAHEHPPDAHPPSPQSPVSHPPSSSSAGLLDRHVHGRAVLAGPHVHLGRQPLALDCQPEGGAGESSGGRTGGRQRDGGRKPMPVHLSLLYSFRRRVQIFVHPLEGPSVWAGGSTSIFLLGTMPVAESADTVLATKLPLTNIIGSSTNR